MLAIRENASRVYDRMSRRHFLQVGALGTFGLSLPSLLQAAPQPPVVGSFGRAKRCLLLFLTGGPSQQDTWDPKPEAPVGIRGEFRPIPTSVPGIHVSEVFPRLARCAQHYCLIRSVTHDDRVHASAGYTMLTGAYHPAANSPGGSSCTLPKPNDYPHVGSLLATVRAPRAGIPLFASLPELLQDAGTKTLYPGQNAGFLGTAYDPWRIQGEPATGRFRLPDIDLPADITAERLAERKFLTERFDRTFRTANRQPAFADLDNFQTQAYALLGSQAVRRAFELDREPIRGREGYGPHLFGQGCLLARRLIEAGVALVTVYWPTEGPADSPQWDTHENNFAHLRNRLAPPADQALAALLTDLADRGLLSETLVVCMAEFGRTPKINEKAGREHWAKVQSVLVAGAGVCNGSVYGASDRQGGAPAEAPVTPPDLIATMLHLLGVKPDMEVHDRTGRPLRACEGTPIKKLLAS